MKFNKVLNANILKEWRFYSIDYKEMKKAIKLEGPYDPAAEPGIEDSEFFRLFELSKTKLTKFYNDKENWANKYYKTMEESVDVLRSTKVSSLSLSDGETNLITDSDSMSGSIVSATDSDDEELMIDIEGMNDSFEQKMRVTTETNVTPRSVKLKSGAEDSEWRKEAYRRVGKSKHFHNYIYAKKSLDTFSREVDLLLEFLQLNQTGFSKILKKFDKRTGSNMRGKKMVELTSTHEFLNGERLHQLKEGIDRMLKEVSTLKPSLPDGWYVNI